MFLLSTLIAQVRNPILQSGLGNDWGYFNITIPKLINLGYLIGILVFVFIFIIGSFQWITAGGDKGKLAEARGKITHALVGLLVLLLIFVITKLVNYILGLNIGALGGPTGNVSYVVSTTATNPPVNTIPPIPPSNTPIPTPICGTIGQICCAGYVCFSGVCDTVNCVDNSLPPSPVPTSIGGFPITPTSTPTLTPVPTNTPRPTSTSTPRPTATVIPTPTPTIQPRPTSTPIPPTSTPTVVPPTPTPTITAFCTDSDGGGISEEFIYGFTTSRNVMGDITTYSDNCSTLTILNEAYCQSVLSAVRQFNCSGLGASYSCQGGKCCLSAGGSCSIDSDCCLGNICNAGRCQVATNIILNEATGQTCHDLCYDSGFRNGNYCQSIGTNNLANNGATYVDSCSTSYIYSCDHGILSSVSSPLCNGYSTNWTYCNCVPNVVPPSCTNCFDGISYWQCCDPSSLECGQTYPDCLN